MDSIQLRHEKAVGDAFIRWFNERNGQEFTYLGRGDEAPDLIYQNNASKIKLEIVDCYYDGFDAQIKWLNARNIAGSPTEWRGINCDESLLMNINAALRSKSAKHYGPSCLLIINVSPAATSADEMAAMISRIDIPQKHGFAGIYLTGTFGSDSTGSIGGYYCWKLH